MAHIYKPQELIEGKYTTHENFNKAVKKSLSLLKELYFKRWIVSGSLFGAAARGDYKRGSDIDIFIITKDSKHEKVINTLNKFSIKIRDIMKIPLDLHVNKFQDIRKGNTYYDPSFISHLVKDCPKSVKIGEPLENVIITNWTAKEAVNARMRIAKLDLARLQAGLYYHKNNFDDYFVKGIQKLFSRTQHTTRNMLFIKGELEKYSSKDRSKKALLELYLKKFKINRIHKIEKEIINAEEKYYKILEKTIIKIEKGKEDIEEYKQFLLNLDYLIPLAMEFFDLNIDLLKKLK